MGYYCQAHTTSTWQEFLDADSLVSGGGSPFGTCLGILGGADSRHGFSALGRRGRRGAQCPDSGQYLGYFGCRVTDQRGMRAFGGYEKGTDYYLHQPLFHLKMTLFVLILLLEIAPMVTLIKWRIALGRKVAFDTGRAKLFARISHVEALLVLLMVVAATGMARGVMFG